MADCTRCRHIRNSVVCDSCDHYFTHNSNWEPELELEVVKKIVFTCRKCHEKNIRDESLENNESKLIQCHYCKQEYSITLRR
jgi:hypothetical protein